MAQTSNRMTLSECLQDSSSPVEDFSEAQGSSPGIPEDQNWSDYDCHVRHQLYQCDIYCWLALGAVKPSRKQAGVPRYFLYSEYRDGSGASRYVSDTFETREEARLFQREGVCRRILPDISPHRTMAKRIPVGERREASSAILQEIN